MKRLAFVALAVLITVGAWSPPTSSSAETTCHIERHNHGASYELWSVCTTSTANMETLEMEVEVTYEFLGTFYYV